MGGSNGLVAAGSDKSGGGVHTESHGCITDECTDTSGGAGDRIVREGRRTCVELAGFGRTKARSLIVACEDRLAGLDSRRG